MVKIIAPIILLILFVYSFIHFWNKANKSKRKNIALMLGGGLLLSILITAYLVIN